MRREFQQILSGLLLNVLLICVVTGQVKTQRPRQEQTDDVIRVKTELVQTDVTVVDKRGRFVGGLRGEDFELRVDSKPQSISFFDEIATGSADEEKQLTAARKGDKDSIPLVKSPGISDSATDRGRVVFFFVDDVHLTTVITHFVENKMTAKDRVAVVSTSGQIGFLQQLTDNKAVLREAISRLNSKFNPETTASKVSISEVDATLVANHGDSGLFAYLLEATMMSSDPALTSRKMTIRIFLPERRADHSQRARCHRNRSRLLRKKPAGVRI